MSLTDNKTIDPLELYDSFRNPEFIMKHSHPIEENDHEVYTVKTKVTMPLLGMVTLGVVYYRGLMKVTPTLFLNDGQAKVLREHNLPLVIHRRKHPTTDEVYFCFPTRSIFERIISM